MTVYMTWNQGRGQWIKGEVTWDESESRFISQYVSRDKSCPSFKQSNVTHCRLFYVTSMGKLDQSVGRCFISQPLLRRCTSTSVSLCISPSTSLSDFVFMLSTHDFVVVAVVVVFAKMVCFLKFNGLFKMGNYTRRNIYKCSSFNI